MRNIYASLNIGTSTTKLLVGEINNSRIDVLYSKILPSQGIKKGLIDDKESVKGVVKELLDDANKELKTTITSVILSIPTYKCTLETKSSSLQVIGDTITAEDIRKCISNASSKSRIPGQSIVTLMPVLYKYNSDSSMVAPIGKKANLLTLDTMVISTAREYKFAYTDILKELGIKVIDTCNEAYACAKEVFSDEYLASGGVLIDIGHRKTTVSCFEDGYLQGLFGVPVGGYDITKEIADTWQLSDIELAEKYKVKYGSCIVDMTDQDVVHTVHDEFGKHEFLRRDLSKVINGKVEELAAMIRERLIKRGDFDLSKQRIMIVGGGGELEGIEEVFTYQFEKSQPCVVDSYRPMAIGAREKSLVANLGLIHYINDVSPIVGVIPSSLQLPQMSTTTMLLKGIGKTNTEKILLNKINKVIDD